MLTMFIWTILFGVSLISLYGIDIGEDHGCLDLLDESEAKGPSSLNQLLKHLGLNSQVTQNINCQCFILLYLMMIMKCMSVLFYPQENRVFLNEHHNRWYSSSSYYLSKSLLEVPPIIVTGVMFSALTYFGTGQVNNFYRFSLYTLNIVSIPDHSFDNFNKSNFFSDIVDVRDLEHWFAYWNYNR